MSKKLLTDLIVLLAIGILGVAGYKLAPLLSPKTDLTLPRPDCDLNNSACSITLPDGTPFVIDILPRPIPALKPLQIEVLTDSERVKSVEVDFAGIDMKMGFNRPRLKPASAGHFVGQATLPVCITGKMGWDVTVLIETAQHLMALPLVFEMEHE